MTKKKEGPLMRPGRKPSVARRINYCAPEDVSTWLRDHERDHKQNDLITLAMRQMISTWESA